MLRKDMIQRIAVDRRGKITTGKKSEKGYPQSLDYFNISAFPELVQEYGEKPERLVIMFPTSNIEDFYSTEYNMWGGKGDKPIKKRQCDGELCTHKVTEMINGIEYLAGTVSACVCKSLPEGDKQRCKCYMGMKAFIVHRDGKIHNPICYMFESHSVNTADNLYSQISNISALTDNRMRGVPFILSVRMVDTITDGQKRRYPVWDIQPFGSIPQIMEMSRQDVLPTTTEQSLQLEAPNENQIEAPKGETKEEVIAKIRAEILKQAGGNIKQAREILFNFVNVSTTDDMKDWTLDQVKDAYNKILPIDA